MTEMFGEAWSPMSVPDLAPDDDDDDAKTVTSLFSLWNIAVDIRVIVKKN